MSLLEEFKALSEEEKLDVIRKLSASINADIDSIKRGERHLIKMHSRLKLMSNARLLEVLRRVRDSANSDIMKIKAGKLHKCKFNYISKE